MKCPVCKRIEVTLESPEFPFCSERCREIDLGNWATEKYVISSPASPGELAGKKSEEDEEE